MLKQFVIRITNVLNHVSEKRNKNLAAGDGAQEMKNMISTNISQILKFSFWYVPLTLVYQYLQKYTRLLNYPSQNTLNKLILFILNMLEDVIFHDSCALPAAALLVFFIFGLTFSNYMILI